MKTVIAICQSDDPKPSTASAICVDTSRSSRRWISIGSTGIDAVVFRTTQPDPEEMQSHASSQGKCGKTVSLSTFRT
jgi:hypothetical protein